MNNTLINQSINDRLVTHLIYNQYNNNTSVAYPDTQAAAHMTVFLLHIWFSCFNFFQLQAAVTHRCLAAAQAKKQEFSNPPCSFRRNCSERASERESRLTFRATVLHMPFHNYYTTPRMMSRLWPVCKFPLKACSI